MIRTFPRRLQDIPLFLILLPLFYFMHGLVVNYIPDLTVTALKMTIAHISAGILTGVLFYLILKSIKKAALIAFLLLSFNFFFTSLHNAIQALFGPIRLLNLYSFVIPFYSAVFISLIIIIARKNLQLRKTFVFLNVTLALLLIIETGNLIYVLRKNKNITPPLITQNLNTCDTCKKPNIFLIVADAYAGNEELKDIFQFDNSPFVEELRQRGFYVAENNRSNYYETPYSIASTFSMDYLRLASANLNKRELLQTTQIIKNNAVASYFARAGYRFRNYSMFDFHDQPKAIHHYHLPTPSETLTFVTFMARVRRELGWDPSKFWKTDEQLLTANKLYDNHYIDSLTRKIASDKSKEPLFVYSHFLMPHFPYVYNSDGIPYDNLDRKRTFNESCTEYIQYLQYTNKKILSLIDHILSQATEKPIILFISDHGFRQLPTGYDKKYYFMNFAAFLLPDGNYSRFYDGITNVNIFRAVINSQFNQHLPMLKDSTRYFNHVNW